MITFPRVRAAGWAIYKRMQGYHLLQNPVGTPLTEVNMIKERYSVLSPHLDDRFVVSRIKRTFTDSGSIGEEKILDSTHYMDTTKLQMTKPRKKYIFYTVKEDNKEPKICTKEEKLFGRRRTKVPVSEHDKIMETKRQTQRNRGYVEMHHSRLYKALSLGLYEQLDGQPVEKRPNFFKVLYRNLTNKGYLNLRQKYLISK